MGISRFIYVWTHCVVLDQLPTFIVSVQTPFGQSHMITPQMCVRLQDGKYAKQQPTGLTS